jgi:hypothetical protein
MDHDRCCAQDASGFYILVPVETKRQKYFVDHVIDVTDK